MWHKLLFPSVFVCFLDSPSLLSSPLHSEHLSVPDLCAARPLLPLTAAFTWFTPPSLQVLMLTLLLH